MIVASVGTMTKPGVLLDKEALASHIASAEFADGTVYIDVACLREENINRSWRIKC